MPKPSQGIATAEASNRIEIDYLFKNRLIIKDFQRSGNLSWENQFGTNTGSIGIETCLNDNGKWLRLIYTFTDQYTDERFDIDYKIEIIGIPSNLGKGFNYYFLCPFSNRKCKILYSAYHSHYFKSRFAYKNPIYYDCQKCSNREYSMTRYFKFKDRLEKFSKVKIREAYKGKKTKSFMKFEYLSKQVKYYDYFRWMVLESYFRKRGLLN